MKFLPLILSALLRRKTRTFFTLASLAAAFLLIGVLQAVNALIATSADFLGADRLIVQSRTSFTQPLPMRMLPRIEAVPGVTRVGHSQFFGGVYQDPRNFFPQFAVDPQRLFDTYPEWTLPPEQKHAFVTTRNGAIAGRNLVDKYGWRIGDMVPLRSFIWPKPGNDRDWQWQLVGVFDGRDEEWQARASLMYLNYAHFDEARSGGKGLAGVFVARVADPDQADEVAAAIDAAFANSPDETSTKSEQDFQTGFLRQLGDIGFIVNAISGAVFFTILILTGYTMSHAVRERIPELAVLKCLGFTDRRVLWLVLIEALLLCSLGAAAGMALAIVALASLPAEYAAVQIGGDVWIIVGGSVLLLAAATGLPPALRAMRLSIVDALAGR
jgi:putative ABC transport system permease protein